MSTRSALARRCLRPAAAALVTWASAAASVSIASPVWIAAGCAVAALIAAVVFHRTRWAVVGVLTIAVACAGGSAAVTASRGPLRDDVTAMQTDGGRWLHIEATVLGRPTVAQSGDLWFDAVAVDVRAGARELRGDVPVRIGVPPSEASHLSGGTAAPGSTVMVTGTAVRPTGPERAELIVRVAHIESASSPGGVWAVFDALRGSLAASARTLPGPAAGLIPGLAVGDTSALDAGTAAAMRSSSLSHLTAVSGANCAIVVGAVFALLGWCRAPRGVRVAGSLIALCCFVILVTPEPSVVRAAAMAGTAMLALVLGRPAMGVAVLSTAVTVVLIADPWTALSLGFALSVVATASLLVLARPLAEGMSRWMPRPLALGLAVPIAAQLACGPLVVLIDPHVPVLGILANLLAEPAAAPATIAGALACIAPVPWLRDGLTALAWVPAAWIVAVARACAAVSDLNLAWVDGIPGALLLAIVGAATAVLLWRRRPVLGRWRRIAAAVIAVSVGITAANAAARTVAGPLTLPSSWQVAMCDVGQGDATLWRSGGAVALVDTGPDPARLDSCLRRFGIDRLDLLVLTHFDLDHVGGTSAVAGRVDLVLHGPTGEPGDQRLLDSLSRPGTRVTRAEAGMTGTIGATRWTALWPGSTAVAGNDASIVIDVTGEEFPRTILLGDLGAKSQAAWGRSVAVPDVRIVKVAHHGSADQDPGIYGRMHPDLGLIGVGAGNRYGHPTASLLATLTALGTTIARTDLDGALAAWLDDAGRLVLWRERHDAPSPAPSRPGGRTTRGGRTGRPHLASLREMSSLGGGRGRGPRRSVRRLPLSAPGRRLGE